MSIEFTCTSCSKAYRVKDELAGRSARCKCGTRLVVPSPVAPLDAIPDVDPLSESGTPTNFASPLDEPTATGPIDPVAERNVAKSLLADAGKLVTAMVIGAGLVWRGAKGADASFSAFWSIAGGAVVGLVVGILLLVGERVSIAVDRGRRVPWPVRLMFASGVLSVGLWIAATIAVVFVATMVSLAPLSPTHRNIDMPEISLQQTLQEQREGFVTNLQPNSNYVPDGPAPDPPNDVFDKVRYRSPAGELVAYVTPDPQDGRRHPAVVWAHGGFGGIGSWFWEPAPWDNDQSAAAFREAGVVLMCPSWRGENDNPGQFELFLGEVDDLVAAGQYVAELPYVDANRVYVAGHSTGGTLTLLAACAESPFRAAFSFGGAPDMEEVLAAGGYGNTPFDPAAGMEAHMRSPMNFVAAIQIPTFYFEGGQEEQYVRMAEKMERLAQNNGRPLEAHVITGGDHFNILGPLTALIADRLGDDTGPQCNLSISEADANQAFADARLGYLRRRREALADKPPVAATPAAIVALQRALAEADADPGSHAFRIVQRPGGTTIRLEPRVQTGLDLASEQDGVHFVIRRPDSHQPPGLLIDWDEASGFSIGDQFDDR